MKGEDSLSHIFFTSLLLGSVCAGLVSLATLLLKPRQDFYREQEKKRNILLTAGLLRLEDPESAIEELYQKKIEPRSLLLGTPPQPHRIYEVWEGDELQLIILPLQGKGLWSTLYGFLALRGDGSTIIGLRFYEHGETPGLGGEIENPDWLAQWPGKQVFDAEGTYRLRVVKGQADRRRLSSLRHEIDGLSGATLTTQGVDALLAKGLGPQGYGPYLLPKITHKGGSPDDSNL